MRPCLPARLLAASVALLLLVPAAALASGQVVLRPAAGTAGSTALLQGTGFPRSGAVAITATGGVRTTVRASAGGAFNADLALPAGRTGRLRIVSRGGRKRVVNTFLATAGNPATQPVEIASSGGERLRVFPPSLVPGASVRIQGSGFHARRRLTLALGGRTRHFRAGRRGGFTVTVRLPATLGSGVQRLVVGGRGVRLSLRLALTGAGPGSPVGGAGLPTSPPFDPGPPAKPANTRAPGVTGTAQEGQTVTADPGAWSGRPIPSFAYRWERCNSSGAGCKAVSGAAAQAYPLKSSDVGHRLRVVVTATNSLGSATATSPAGGIVQPRPVPTGVRALWHMDEPSGSSMFDSVGGHTGTLHSVSPGQPGFAGSAYGFNGSGYVSVPSSGALNPGSAAVTIVIHFKTTQRPPPEDWDLIRKGIAGDPGEYKVEYYPDGRASCGFGGSSGHVELKAGPVLSDGQWHSIQCTKTSSGIRLVVDGQTFSKSGSVGSISNGAAIAIGARPGSEFFRGTLDEASISIG